MIESTILTNVGLFSSLVIPGSPVLVIAGENGVGKTTIIKSYVALFDGGHFSELIGPSGSKATIEVKFSDGMRAIKTITQKGYKLEVFTRDGSMIEKPAEYMRSLSSGLTLSPAEFIDTPKEKRLKWLQDRVSATFTKAELDEACEVDTFADPEMDLARFSRFFDGVYAKRTETNAEVKRMDTLLQDLRRNMAVVTSDGVDWISRADELSTLLSDKRTEFNGLSVTANDAFKAKRDAITANLEKAIAELQRKAQEDIEAAKAKIAVLLDQERVPLQAEIEGLAGEVATARANAQQQTTAKANEETLKKIDAEHGKSLREVSRLDRAVEALRKLKASKLDAISVTGLDVRLDGTLVYEGKDFDTQLNTAQQIIVAIQIMAKGPGRMPFFILDNAEHLDATTRAELAEYGKAKGFQIVMAVVEDQMPLTLQAV